MTVVSRGDKAINERYRPMRLSEMIGNELTKANLTQWMAEGNKRARALLLSGATSGGKSTTSRILAMGLNCEKGDTVEPCLECESCRAAMNGDALHIFELNMSELTGKDDASEVTNSMYQRCMTGRNKVYILDEVQMMSTKAQNQMLKVVENPPPNVYLIFCTTEPNKLIPTLRNRMQKFYFNLPTDKEIGELVKAVMEQEHYEFTKEEKMVLFNKIKGKPYRDILFIIEQFAKTHSVEGIKEILDEEKFDPYPMAKEIIYRANFSVFKDAIDKGININYENLRLMMATLCAKKLTELGFTNVPEATRYYNALKEINANKMYDANNFPNGAAMVWRVCAELKP